MVGQNVGKYRILDRLGKGGMGTVYKAVDETLHREVAIKVLNAELNDPEVARRFRTEAITIARLSHPGIATIYELFEHQGEWLMVMEFVRGETLENMVSRMGPLSLQRAAEFCMQALAALAHAHSMGVIHRDLKPANLMVTENGAIKVMDFGIARVAGGEHLTNAGFMMGTPSYMAPEQVRGGEIDARADLYSMGVVFYRLITARLPFKGDTAFAMIQSQVNDAPTPIASLRPDLPPWAEEIVARSLAKIPEQRFQSAIEFHEAFARSLAGLPISSIYSRSPSDPGITPPRAMPIPTGAYPSSLTPATPYSLTSSRMTVLAPGTNPGALAASTDQTALTPALGQSTARLDQTATNTTATAAPPAGAVHSKSTTRLIIAAIGVVAVVLWSIYSNRTPNDTAGPPAAPQPSPNASTAAAPSPSATPTSAPGSATALTPPLPSTTPTPAVTPAATAAPPSRVNAAAATPSPTATPAPASIDTVLATFGGVKFYAVDGKRTTDRDVLVNFLNGQVMVMPRNGGAPIASVPYKRILRATYSQSRDPKWDSSLPGPPEGLDVGSFMRQSRHWLVVQGAETYAVLRLDGENFRQVLSTFEQRTGIKIQRPQ